MHANDRSDASMAGAQSEEEGGDPEAPLLPHVSLDVLIKDEDGENDCRLVGGCGQAN